MSGSTLRKVLFFLGARSPNLRKTLIKIWYEFLARRYRYLPHPFMNYGYAPAQEDPLEPVLGDDEITQLFIQLYDRALWGVDLKDKDVIEIGSGRGGGCAHMMASAHPRSVLGVDFSKNAIALCSERYVLPGLAFGVADAEALYYPSSSFDVVVCIETSHCFKSMSRAVHGFHRVLREGGILVWADFRDEDEVAGIHSILGEPTWRLLRNEDITEGVLRAMDMLHEAKLQFMREHLPVCLHGWFRLFSGTRDSNIYDQLQTGRKVYLCKVVAKV